MTNIYLDRDNTIKLRLEQDGNVVEEGAAHRAIFRLPPFVGDDNVFDTDTDSDISLENNSTEIHIQAGQRELRPGAHQGFLTVYDQAHPNGIAWAALTVNIQNWPIE